LLNIGATKGDAPLGRHTEEPTEIVHDDPFS
jgi:hypothetical protein